MAENHPLLIATVLDSTDARALAEFYRELLGYVYRSGDEPPAPGQADPGADWLVLMDEYGQPRLAFQQVDALPAATWPDPEVPQQLHLDLGVVSVDELMAQNERVLSLGATLLEDRSNHEAESIIVYADPSGHPFCIIVVPAAS